jgi:hypothetical protein
LKALNLTGIRFARPEECPGENGLDSISLAHGEWATVCDNL